MKNKLFRFAPGLLILLLLFAACNSSDSNKMKGIWRVDNVDAQFDEERVNPQTLEQIITTEKQTILKFVNDSNLHIILGETTMKAFWNIEKNGNRIYYYFEGAPTDVYELGTLKENKLITETNTPIGTIKVIYSKSDKK